MIDDVRLAYAALTAHPAPTDAGLTILPMKSVDGVYVGVDAESRQHLLLATSTEHVANHEVTTIAVTIRNLVVAGHNVRLLDITCLFAALSEVFDHFAAAVIQRVSVGGEGPNSAVEHVLGTWREFLVPPADPPSRDKLAATLGELLIVRDTVKTTGTTDIGFWLGPFGQRHDMRSGPTAIEVKTTRSHTGYKVKIHGEDQLLPPDGGALYLHFVRLEEVQGGSIRVTALVDELLGAGVSAQKLFSALTANGVSVADLQNTDHLTFEVRERLTLVVDERTPRIVPASFVGGNRPLGVLDVSYVVDLTDAVADSLDANEYQVLLTTLASVAAS